jgi:Cytochrome c553
MKLGSMMILGAILIAAGAHAEGAMPAGTVAAGKAKSAICAACHGMDGNSTDPQYPKLAGQQASYIYRQLVLFKTGVRQNPIMLGMAMPLSDQDMADLAAYFSAQKIITGVADPKAVAVGQALYRGGDRASGVPACMACHGPDGRGNPGAVYPHLAGQHATYLRTVLTAWHDGTTWGKTTHAEIMPTIARRLTAAQIADVASYIAGLHTATPIVPTQPTVNNAAFATNPAQQ